MKLIMANNKEMRGFVHSDFLDDIESNMEIKEEPGSDQALLLQNDLESDEILEIHTDIEIKEEYDELVAKENFPAQKSDLALVKVSYFQNDFWMSSFEPKNEQKYFCISALPL